MSLTIGIIGFGNFGKFITEQVPDTCSVLIHDPHASDHPSPHQRVSIEDCITQSDIIFLAIPLSSYRTVLHTIKRHIRPTQLIVDICSVKTVPLRLLEEYLPKHKNILVTHPLFGPQTFDKSNPSNYSLILCKSKGTLAEKVLSFCKNEMGLTITKMSVAAHDKLMADIHALTFFIAKGLANLNITPHEITTPSYKMITDLVAFSGFHTEDLLHTIENGNPYAKHTRSNVLKVFNELHEQLLHTTNTWDETHDQ